MNAEVSQEKDGASVVTVIPEDTRIMDLMQNLDPKTDVFEEKLEEKVGGADGSKEEKVEGKEAEAEAGKEEEVVVVSEDKKAELERENLELRQTLREFKRGMSVLEEKHAKVEKLLDSANLIDPETKERQIAENAVYEKRMEYLEDVLEIMRINPKFEDVDDVVSQTHFDDLVEAMTEAHISENGGKKNEVIKQISSSIWGMKNPYKYAYDMIKKYHPDYRKAAPVAEPKKEEKKEEKEPVKTVTSIHDIPGGKSVDKIGGWTSKMIDDLEEDELAKVPKDVYDKYLKNQLP